MIQRSNYAGWRVADFAARSPLIRQVLERAEHESSGMKLESRAKQNLWVDEADKPHNGPVSVTPTPNGNGVKVDDPMKTAAPADSSGSERVAPNFVDPRAALLI